MNLSMYEFNLRLRPDPAYRSFDVLEFTEMTAYMGASWIVVGPEDDRRFLLTFTRESGSLEQAARSAVADVREAMPSIMIDGIDLGGSDEKAGLALLGKLAVMDTLRLELEAWMEANQLKSDDVAKILDVNPLRVSAMLRNEANDLTIDCMMDILLRTGKSVRFEMTQERMRMLSIFQLWATPARADDDVRKASSQDR